MTQVSASARRPKRSFVTAMIGRSWSRIARSRRLSGVRFGSQSSSWSDWEEGRLRWVREHARGNSFADIGGMFKYMGDVAFLAEESGATAVTLLDVGDPDLPAAGFPEWGWFAKKRDQRGSKVRYVQGDLEDPATASRVGVHDLVFFSGVLYHTPNPVLQLMQLRQITGKLLFLSTLTIPEIPGFQQGCVFYPFLTESALAPFAAGYPWADSLVGIGRPLDERPMYGQANCWWGITPSALRAMLTAARFEVVSERRPPNWPFMIELIARPLPLDPMLPPVSYYRERAEARERGEARWNFDTWYDEQRNRS